MLSRLLCDLDVNMLKTLSSLKHLEFLNLNRTNIIKTFVLLYSKRLISNLSIIIGDFCKI